MHVDPTIGQRLTSFNTYVSHVNDAGGICETGFCDPAKNILFNKIQTHR